MILLLVLLVLAVLVWAGRGGLRRARMRPAGAVLAVFLLVAAGAMAVHEAWIPALGLAVVGAGMALLARWRR